MPRPFDDLEGLGDRDGGHLCEVGPVFLLLMGWSRLWDGGSSGGPACRLLARQSGAAMVRFVRLLQRVFDYAASAQRPDPVPRPCARTLCPGPVPRPCVSGQGLSASRWRLWCPGSPVPLGSDRFACCGRPVDGVYGLVLMTG